MKPHVTTVKELISMLQSELSDSGAEDLPVKFALDSNEEYITLSVYSDRDTNTRHCKGCKCDKHAKTMWIDIGL